MEMVILVGVQAAGKSTYFAKCFANTHVRVNLDMLRTRRREARLIETCLDLQQPLVIDNTNLRAQERQTYISAAKQASFTVRGFYFESKIQDCLRRNAERPGSARLPNAAIRAGHTRLEVPSLSEGFETLTYVRIAADGRFEEREWSDEI